MIDLLMVMLRLRALVLCLFSHINDVSVGFAE